MYKNMLNFTTNKIEYKNFDRIDIKVIMRELVNEYTQEFVNELNIDTNDLGSLGTFKWGPKKNPYVAFCDLNTVREKFNNGFNYYRVKGRGYGKQFGYGNTSQTIGKTYRKQIFKQIIDKYDLDSYK
jgi:hypothetical protein